MTSTGGACGRDNRPRPANCGRESSTPSVLRGNSSPRWWNRARRSSASPLVTGSHPLLCFDVWEHAYYLDYKADRKAHLKAVISRHANWAFAADRLASDPA